MHKMPTAPTKVGVPTTSVLFVTTQPMPKSLPLATPKANGLLTYSPDAKQMVPNIKFVQLVAKQSTQHQSNILTTQLAKPLWKTEWNPPVHQLVATNWLFTAPFVKSNSVGNKSTSIRLLLTVLARGLTKLLQLVLKQAQRATKIVPYAKSTLMHKVTKLLT